MKLIHPDSLDESSREVHWEVIDLLSYCKELIGDIEKFEAITRVKKSFVQETQDDLHVKISEYQKRCNDVLDTPMNLYSIDDCPDYNQNSSKLYLLKCSRLKITICIMALNTKWEVLDPLP